MTIRDRFGRPLQSLRLSVTDRCNLRCLYCMPELNYRFLPQKEILTFEEMSRLVKIFASLGVREVRVTGGEPLMRKDLPLLVSMLSAVEGVDDLCMTTNASKLDFFVEPLISSGLHRLTISLDTLNRERFTQMAGRDELPQVLSGIERSKNRFQSLKLNMVVMRNKNDDEMIEMLRYGKSVNAEVRFIEYMDVGGATKWNSNDVVSRTEILGRLKEEFGRIDSADKKNESTPADSFVLPDGTRFGVIASTTAPFCMKCDRSRITADGMWYLCLYAVRGVDFRKLLRDGTSDEAIREIVESVWTARDDRGAEERAGVLGRGPLFQAERLRVDPHLEMHTRGG